MQDPWQQFKEQPSRGSKLSEQVQSEIIERFHAGETQRALASEFGVSMHTIQNYIGRTTGKPSTGFRAHQNRLYKTTLRSRGVEVCCEACGWTPPRQLWQLVEVHHIVPISQGGKDEIEQVILLCPNHHALADALFRPGLDRPPTREELIAAVTEPAAHIARRMEHVHRLLEE